MTHAIKISVLAAVLLIGGCTTAPRDGSPRIQTSSDANRESLQGAVAAPLRDVNILRTKIPDILLLAVADPFARPRKLTCPALIAMVAPLDAALGPDLDQPLPDDDDLMQRGREGALGAVAGVAQDVIPFRGWVRKLTGAERHDKLVQQAIMAGAVRRGYLKGLGESKGCRPPATPMHKAAPPIPPTQEIRPQYPAR